MTPAELQKILRSDEKLTVKQVKEIIWELKNDVSYKPYIDKNASLNYQEFQKNFYNGEANAFYICLDLLEKVEEDE